MRKLIPDFIINRHLQGQLAGSQQAHILNVDLKGITALTQALMSHSHAGVEVLTDTVNALFTPAIEAIESRGGFVSSFAGDAFTAIFPVSDKTEIAGNSYTPGLDVLSAALKIKESVVAQGRQITEFGDFVLEVRIGVAAGEVKWSIIETQTQAAYWFSGAGIQAAVQAQNQAQANQVIAEKAICERLGIFPGKSLENKECFCCLDNIPTLTESKAYETTNLAADAFIPAAILSQETEGEFRILLSCFINLTNPVSEQVIVLIDAAVKHGGYLSHIDCTDKGWVAYVMFGAPLGYEKMAQRAMEFALEVENLCRENARIGLTQGKAFTGFIGSHSRAEYTGMGMAVNLAARFMTQAAWGDLWFDEAIRKELYDFVSAENLGELYYKGYPFPIVTYRLTGKLQTSNSTHYKSGFVGRDEELARLVGSCQTLFSGNFAGVCYIYGEAGQGKSRLVFELERQLGDQVLCFELQTDNIHKNSLNPFSYWLRQQFTSIQIGAPSERLSDFRKNWSVFLQKIRALPGTEKSLIELMRVESILAGLLGLEWEGSIYSNLDSKYRPTATGFALRALLEAFCLLKPVLLIIEDLHWLDKDSEEVITILSRRAASIPFKLILTARPFDDGRLPVLNLDKDISIQTINLDGLNQQQVNTVINNLLPPASQASPELAEYVYSIAQGNPFIVEQLTRYLVEAGQLHSEGDIFRLKAQTAALPSGVQAILVARLDRLEAELKHTVQTASILGREFAVDILSEMLETLENRPDYLNDIVVRSQLYAGEQEHIWNSLSEIKYIFSHSLLREAAYAMQLKKQTMQLHHLAAQVMEKHYAKDNTKLSEIATHYYNAGETQKASEYFEQCAKNEELKGNRLESVKWARRSLELAPERHSALVQLITSLDAADLRLEARELAMHKLDELEKAGLENDPKAYDMLRLVVLTCNSEFDTQEMEPWTLRLYERTKQMFPEQSFEMFHVYNSLGSLYMNKQMFEESEKYYRKVLALCENSTGEARHEANNTLNDLGLLYCHLQRFEEALPLLESAIKAHDEEYGEGHPGSIYTLINYASALFRSGQHEAALQRYLRTKQLILEKVGKDHDMYFKVMQHLSGIYTELERYEDAEACLRENLDLQISRKDDCTFEVAVLLRGLAGVLNRTGELSEAEVSARRSVDIFKKVAPPESFQAIVAHKVLAQVLFHLEKYDEALAELLDLINLTLTIGSDPYDLIIFYQNAVVEIYTRQKRWSEAEKFLSSVISRYQEQGANSSVYAPYQEKHAEVLIKLGSNAYSTKGQESLSAKGDSGSSPE
jgi:predicted ATPase/class 3 adenylate cyclase